MIKYLLDLDPKALPEDWVIVVTLRKGYFKLVIELILNNGKIIDKEWKRKVKEYLLENMSTIAIPVAQVRKIRGILQQNKW